MAVTTHTPPRTVTAVPQLVAHDARRERGGWLSWVTTTDHKKIGILYIATAIFFFIIGGVEALLMRLQLGVPENTLISPEKYNALLTMHGTTMIFLFVVPIWAGFANYFLPLMIGARDMAFPRLNAWSYWMFLFGGLAMYASLFWKPPEAGWTMYAPLSTEFVPGNGTDAWIYLIHLTGLSSVIGAINFLVTTFNMRAPGMGWARLPLFVWSMIGQAVMLVVALPPIAGAVTMLLTDRHFGTHFFVPTIEGGERQGSALLYQHLFWFFGHPEVYIMILPAFGIISEILPVFARKPIFGYKAVAAATVGIAFLSMLVWAHHMFATPIVSVVLAFFMISSVAIAIPTGVKVLNWCATLWRGSLHLRTPLYWALGFLAMFTLGGVTGVMLAVFPVDWQLHDTYFVVAHFHYVLVAGSVNAIFAALYYWFPKMTGRMMNERWGKVSFWFTFVGFNVTFLVQHSLGLSGMPRRIYEYYAGNGWDTYNLISTIGAFILGTGVVISVLNALWSYKRGAPAGPDPWRGNTLEWLPTSPPPPHNFDVIPRVRSVEPMQDIRRQVARTTLGEAATAGRREQVPG
jgi:cytochrome c oxidase subunit 1